jgi:hypothetical protein
MAGARTGPSHAYRNCFAILQETDMAEYILLMHNDALDDEKAWEPYIQRLKQTGYFEGGSAIGGGVCARKNGAAPR